MGWQARRPQHGSLGQLQQGSSPQRHGGIAGSVFALAVLPNNELVAAGEFTVAGGVPVANIARWNGSSWLPLEFTGAGALAAVTSSNGVDVQIGGMP